MESKVFPGWPQPTATDADKADDMRLLGDQPNHPELLPDLRPGGKVAKERGNDFEISTNGTNKLLEAAMPMLGASIRLRGMRRCGSVEALHGQVVIEIQSFERMIEGAGYDSATMIAARYILCAVVDEAVLSTHWGADSMWSERPLLSVYHNETWGGEKVFAILERVMAESHRFFDLMELIYYAISLGFEGKYHVQHNGQARLDQLLETIYKHIEKHRGEPPKRLTEPEPRIASVAHLLSWRMPFWAYLVIALFALIIIHQAFDIPLEREVDRIREVLKQTLATTNGGDN
ncbi:type IVB secretion system protein IcmH/DotU [Roseinatronobacter monicus]|uniref:Type VI secretion system protein ImpK n=1 Tax=Roseinatronobacter monicus TaxID=393481 RepID=A0A543K4F9_9RHOB|nr:type IVB secretion system protein IcmH/DotU [Roseinatronobacter monicus]TQM89968.1 type VI secretion system protein ImpK [Roseinatronobacter monicus]